jgi:hypothetical protein
MNDPCKVLDVSIDASEDEIKAAYKRMVSVFVVFAEAHSHSRHFRPGAGILIATPQGKKKRRRTSSK